MTFSTTMITGGLLVLCLAPAIAFANVCDDIPVPPLRTAEKEQSTKASIDLFKGLLRGVPINASMARIVKEKEVEALHQFPNADQFALTLVAMKYTCRELEASSLGPLERIRVMTQTRQNQQTEVPVPKIAPAIRSASELPPASRKVLRSTPDFQVIETPGGREGWDLRYLAEPPLELTSENSWFTIVASPSSAEEGEQKLTSLRSRFPQYDFSLFEPYNGNKNWGIMMASFVSQQRAAEALAIARAKIDKGSYMWIYPRH